MTLTLNLSPAAEAQLSKDAARAGLPISEYALQLLMEKIEKPTDRIHRLAEEIAGPGHVADISRDAIYAE